ncbi:MAG: 5-oxoprolinase subunit PxpB [Lentimonas sp.]
MDFKLQSYGERAVLIQELDEKQQFCVIERLKTSAPEGFVEYVIGYSNLLVLFKNPLTVDRFPAWLATLPVTAPVDKSTARLVEIPVKYNGADLSEVAELTQINEDGVVAMHSRAEYRVRMMGFAPGFPYLDGLDSRLHLHRRASPRNHIAPGSVAIGGSHAGIYSVASPGGWHILGHTDYPLFQADQAKVDIPEATAVFALAPGDRVKFVAID